MGVLVLGMHRSGTSALAGALASMGFDVGPDDDVMPADVDNVDGYFELLSVVDANDDLLAHFGGRWDSPPDFPPHWTSDAASVAFVDGARGLIGQRFASEHYLLKDPRISLLLPLWRQVTEDRGCAVVIVRDPSEVAASLAKRNGIQTLAGLALWAAYNRAMLRDLQGARVHVCNYTDLVERPVDVLSGVVSSLRAWGELADDVDLTKSFATVRPELRRNRSVSADLEADAPPAEISELMKLTLDLRGRHDEFVMGSSLEPAWWEGPLLEERRALLQWALAAIATVEAHNADLLTENDALWRQSDEVTLEAERLRSRLERIRRLVPRPLRRITSRITP